MFTGERINEFLGLSLDPRNLLLQKSVLQETVLPMEDSPCINPLALYTIHKLNVICPSHPKEYYVGQICGCLDR